MGVKHIDSADKAGNGPHRVNRPQGHPILAGERTPFVTREGLPFLLLAAAACWVLVYYDSLYAVLPAVAFLVLFLIFRDPAREVPAAPLGIVSPVDGRVVKIDPAGRAVLVGDARRVTIRINPFGTYSARCPVEGKIMDLNTVGADRESDYSRNALWVQTDEGDDVVLQFRGYRFGFAPKSFIRFGERLGQGQRCAYLRLARFAELHVPADSKLLVESGQKVLAGQDLIGKLPPP